MNENISWGKIAVLVVAIAGVAGLAFEMGKKSMVALPVAVAPVVETSRLQLPISAEKILPSEKISSGVDWSKVEFDACGKQAKYEKLPWWKKFSVQVEKVPFYNDTYIDAKVYSGTTNEYENPKKIKYTYETYCQDLNRSKEDGADSICSPQGKSRKMVMSDFDTYGEGCLAKDGSAFIAVFPGGYMDGGNHIFRYDITNDILEETKQVTRNSGEPVNIFAVPSEFLKREGSIVKMQGSNGDAGCGGTSYYDFDLVKNTVQEMRSCGQCEGQKIMECDTL